MITFDNILKTAAQILLDHAGLVNSLPWLLVNRDLNGKVRLMLVLRAKRKNPRFRLTTLVNGFEIQITLRTTGDMLNSQPAQLISVAFFSIN